MEGKKIRCAALTFRWTVLPLPFPSQSLPTHVRLILPSKPTSIQSKFDVFRWFAGDIPTKELVEIMIACIEHLVAGVEQESPPVANCDDEMELDVALLESLDVAGAVDFSAAAVARCAADFGGLRHLPPIAVIFPACPDDVARVVRAAGRSRRLTVAARGNGHSMSGQATAPGGVVVEMGAMGGGVAVHRWRDGYVADVGGGVLWEELLRACVGQGLAPRSWTDYLGLTVGGTLSNAGVSGQAFRHGPQTANVTELQVVTGAGDVVACSEVQHSDLFHAVLGGLGQFGVITRARIVLEPAPDMVRWVRLVYSNFAVFSSDAESLVVAAADDGFDYVEGFVFVNSDDPVNGWGSVPIGDRRLGSPAAIPAGAGPVLYCLEVGYYYRNSDGFGVVDKAVEERLRPLSFVPGHRYDADVGYVDFLGRVNAAEAASRAAGTWAAPHQWLNLFVPKRDIADFDRIVFQSLLKRGVGGPMLVYPLLRSKWDRRTSVVLPEVEGEEVFYLVALLRFNRPYPEGPAVDQLQAGNQAVIDRCAGGGLAVKLYLPHYRSEEQWRRHFGKQWGRFVERKARYDPLAVLAPGQRIFDRRSSAAPPPF